VSYATKRGDKMERQPGDGVSQSASELDNADTDFRTHGPAAPAATAAVPQRRNFGNMLAAERSRAGSLAASLCFLLIEISHL
jgi:hypothetical protein